MTSASALRYLFVIIIIEIVAITLVTLLTPVPVGTDVAGVYVQRMVTVVGPTSAILIAVVTAKELSTKVDSVDKKVNNVAENVNGRMSQLIDKVPNDGNNSGPSSTRNT